MWSVLDAALVTHWLGKALYLVIWQTVSVALWVPQFGLYFDNT